MYFFIHLLKSIVVGFKTHTSVLNSVDEDVELNVLLE